MLRLSTKGRYAARIMVCLAVAGDGATVKKQDIADSEHISSDYVEQILISLKLAGLVSSVRGARGGFTLTRPAHAITIAQVLEATEGPLCLVPCVDDACGRSPECPTRDVWQEANSALREVFARRTIAELASQRKLGKNVEPWSYSI